MANAVRSCAGGVVFRNAQVFLLMSDRGEWVMPTGIIRSHNRATDVALWRVEDETGIHARIIGNVGNTRYEGLSESREQDVNYRVQWFVMAADDDNYRIAFDQGFLNGGYYDLTKARTLLSHEQDRSILDSAFETYKKYLLSEA